ncbi:hypothetical protein E2553_42690 [Paraburkholderia dipogonis]|uniref:Uncharacterized protein n=1 Tax=Paraburkholderia dipogonis TaxID=1211383 RepID=A0A4Y8MGE9_9BURK|nr:hypothetical protein [Paraburkholderia dipogonis]TFE36463.1 hypothetical protein E2553_42690 [Paraburkholderia dipogonis]
MNYRMRYHKGLPIGSSIAESAVNLVVSHRMAKKQQMRWTEEGAHCLAQVRVAVVNEEFSVEKLAVLTATSATFAEPEDSTALSCRHVVPLGSACCATEGLRVSRVPRHRRHKRSMFIDACAEIGQRHLRGKRPKELEVPKQIPFVCKLHHRSAGRACPGQTVQSPEHTPEAKQQFSSVKSVVHCSYLCLLRA